MKIRILEPAKGDAVHGPAARRAILELRKSDDLLRAEHRLFKRKVKVISEIIAFCRPLSPLTSEAGAKQIAEDILEDVAETCS